MRRAGLADGEDQLHGAYWKQTGDGPYKGKALYGCLRKSGQIRLLDRMGPPAPNAGQQLHHLRLSGSSLAFAVTAFCTVCGDGGPYTMLDAVEVRSGERRRIRQARSGPGDGYGDRVDALTVDACGRVAYRVGVADLYEDPDPDPQLILWTKRSRTVVDRGRIEPRSIRLRPTALLWKRDGTQMRAALHRCRPLGA